MQTIQDVREKLKADPAWDDDDRVGILNRVGALFSPVSRNEMANFNTQHRATVHDYDDYTRKMNELFGNLIDIEVSETGSAVREALGLEPLSLESTF